MKNKLLSIAGIIFDTSLAALFYLLPSKEGTPVAQEEIVIDPAKEAFIDGICSNIQADGIASEVVFVNVGERIQTGISSLPTLTWITKVLEIDDEGHSIHAEYPEFSGGQIVAKLNKHVRSLLDEEIADSEQYLDFSYPRGTCSDEICLDTKYQVVDVVNGIVSFELVHTNFTGGGAGNHDSPVVVNWNLKTDEPVSSRSLFCEENYREILAPMVRKKIVVDAGNYCGADMGGIRGWVYDGVDPRDEWMFLVDKKGITAVFSPYQVSSGSAGIVHARIPVSSLPENILCLP